MIYRAHRMQTGEHAEHLLKRLQAHGSSPSKVKDVAAKGGALGVGGAALAAPDTPATLAAAAFAYENFEVASYRLLHSLAERAGDGETVSVVERILEQEEAACGARGRDLRPRAGDHAGRAGRESPHARHAARQAIRSAVRGAVT